MMHSTSTLWERLQPRCTLVSRLKPLPPVPGQKIFVRVPGYKFHRQLMLFFNES